MGFAGLSEGQTFSRCALADWGRGRAEMGFSFFPAQTNKHNKHVVKVNLTFNVWENWPKNEPVKLPRSCTCQTTFLPVICAHMTSCTTFHDGNGLPVSAVSGRLQGLDSLAFCGVLPTHAAR